MRFPVFYSSRKRGQTQGMRQPSGQKASPPWFGGKVNDHSARRQQGQPLPRQHQGRRCVKDQLCVEQRPLQLACRQRLHAIAADLGQVLPLPGRGRYPGAQRPQTGRQLAANAPVSDHQAPAAQQGLLRVLHRHLNGSFCCDRRIHPGQFLPLEIIVQRVPPARRGLAQIFRHHTAHGDAAARQCFQKPFRLLWLCCQRGVQPALLGHWHGKDGAVRLIRCLLHSSAGQNTGFEPVAIQGKGPHLVAVLFQQLAQMDLPGVAAGHNEPQFFLHLITPFCPILFPTACLWFQKYRYTAKEPPSRAALLADLCFIVGAFP